MTRARDDRGFTLIELMVAMTIGLVAFGGVMTILEVLLRQSHAHRLQIEAQDQARTAADQLAASMRNSLATPGVAPTAVERADPYDLIFQTVDPFVTPAPGGNTLGAMRVRYCLDTTNLQNEVLRMQTQRWTTAAIPAAPAATACTSAANGWDDSKSVSARLVNRLRTPERPVFVYSPASYATLAAINAVQVTLVVDRDPASVRGERELTSGVTLRNANQAPVADFTLSQASGYVMLNASASYDPDGDGLTFKWFMDGSDTGVTTRIFRRTGISPGNHTFTLEAYDSSGLKGIKTRTVNVT